MEKLTFGERVGRIVDHFDQEENLNSFRIDVSTLASFCMTWASVGDIEVHL